MYMYMTTFWFVYRALTYVPSTCLGMLGEKAGNMNQNRESSKKQNHTPHETSTVDPSPKA